MRQERGELPRSKLNQVKCLTSFLRYESDRPVYY